jgi:hypothetical protein
LIQFNESRVFEFGPRMSHRSAGQRLEEFSLGQFIEKLVEVPLEGANGLLQKENHEHGESQLALTGKILGAEPMPIQKARVQEQGAQRLDQSDEVGGNVVKNALHSQCKGQKIKTLYNSKCTIIQLSFLNSMAVPRPHCH